MVEHCTHSFALLYSLTIAYYSRVYVNFCIASHQFISVFDRFLGGEGVVRLFICCCGQIIENQTLGGPSVLKYKQVTVFVCIEFELRGFSNPTNRK